MSHVACVTFPPDMEVTTPVYYPRVWKHECVDAEVPQGPVWLSGISFGGNTPLSALGQH